MTDHSITLDDRYTATSGRVFLTGTQALVRLPMLQRQRDLAAGLNTAGFVSGYRGSPLGSVDQAFWRARQHLEAANIVFQPAVNEDLAATAVWGTQQIKLFPGARYDGVFAMWYGKGPGVDRCGDVFRHANAAGTAKLGGVLVIAGDDHAAKSSTLPHQTEHVFKAVMMPVLYPANLQEYLDYGLHGWAMSRYSGCWVVMKALADTVETSASVSIDPLSPAIRLPDDFAMPANDPNGLNIRWPDPPLQQEARLINSKLYAALAYCRANRLNRIVIDSNDPASPARLGIITAGKAYLDVRQALDELGIDEELAAQIGLRVYKIGMVWPLEADGVRRFAEGLEEILVVEEKRQLLEYQLKEELYNWREDVRPRVVGKFDDKGEWSLLPTGSGHLTHGDWLLPAAGELSVAQVARALAARIGRFFTSPTIAARMALIEAKQRALSPASGPMTGSSGLPIQRIPYFCSGCPHNTSTHVPAGSRAVAGIGCHYMVTWMDRNTATFTHMGGEGVTWVGQAPFSNEKHVFANLGDGTYFHSGLLAIRQAVAAGVSITYKILYNDAVAMTGGQPVDGSLSVGQLTRQLAAEGVGKIVIVTDEPEYYAELNDLAPHTPVHHRRELDAVQRELRRHAGVSALIYAQTCATEKRRRRKRGKLADPPRRVFINPAVCEGCGDCSVQSNCLSVVPLDTEFGRKRAIDQSSCNKDFSCLNGFCPSLVTVEGGRLRAGKAIDSGQGDLGELPAPPLPDTKKPFNILLTGVGGTGIVTLGAVLGMAAHLDGKGVSVLDMTGLAQKFGAVFAHLRIADRPEDLHAARIATGEADALIGGDLVVAASPEALSKVVAGKTRAVVNVAETPTADFTRNPDWQFPQAQLRALLDDTCGPGQTLFLDAADLARRLLGNTIYTNLFMLGVAWQRGLVPVSLAALEKAIELNGTATERNREAFVWGRWAAHDGDRVRRLSEPEAMQTADGQGPSDTLAEIVRRRREALVAYQNVRYAERYSALLSRVRQVEAAAGRQSSTLAEAVARNYYKLLAYKDEYEVARLHSDAAFHEQLRAEFEGDFSLHFHLAPPLFARPDRVTGRIEKRAYGPWMLRAFALLRHLKFLRGTFFDPFARSAERRLERQLLAEYEADIELIVQKLTPGDEPTLNAAIELASLPEKIRGFAHVKAKAAEQTRERRATLRQILLANAAS
ncbi:MAG TPA: indolepyruvate ferredoxin oxidoreductase family protein [Accumulibacter sp.]|uniref:indolepyruvate ferredoxin oxidoreductase family protein n=1 Tax=Accumulibacter sp. TaxID=2053492 RepID=UPI002D1D8F10|nr:indolepyruvate ferredoxin oxidoreductase family protein [Accumulibacter sp.]HNI50839.1 indolepyruvate ferredoxin oxidoreductase family protein [Accumulibacter sp.]HNK02824.1 indolepyruvate ferredoxin oxidoreductase family protein [Accumulibacter sp.]HNN83681.1 indolepyruvate ferredoxin oxidoreductase family protein [Accumulibacter sp.]